MIILIGASSINWKWIIQSSQFMEEEEEEEEEGGGPKDGQSDAPVETFKTGGDSTRMMIDYSNMEQRVKC